MKILCNKDVNSLMTEQYQKQTHPNTGIDFYTKALLKKSKRKVETKHAKLKKTETKVKTKHTLLAFRI